MLNLKANNPDSSINIISDNESSDFYCRMCVSQKLFLYDKANQLYKCPTCGSLFKYTKPSCKPKLSVDTELDNLGGTKIMFFEEKKKRDRDLPEVDGNIEILDESEVIR